MVVRNFTRARLAEENNSTVADFSPTPVALYNPPSPRGDTSLSIGPQHTLAGTTTVKGVGFVYNQNVTVRLRPAPVGLGRVFMRTDQPGQPCLPASIDHLSHTNRRTALCYNNVSVEMTEHLLAALAGVGVDNCVIELDAAEAPGLDGSSMGFVHAVTQLPLQQQSAQRQPLAVSQPIRAEKGDAYIELAPGPTDRLDIRYILDLGPDSPLQAQEFQFSLTRNNFVKEVAPARTFIFDHEILALRNLGLGLRATYSDLVIFDSNAKPIQNALRFDNEPARHKALDVVGDLALLGRPVVGTITAYKSGHALNAQLVRHLMDQTTSRQQAA